MERLTFEDLKFVVENKESHSMEQCAIAYASLEYYEAEFSRDTKEAKANFKSLRLPMKEYIERQLALGDAGDPKGWNRINFEQLQLPLTLGGKPYTPIIKQEFLLNCNNDTVFRALLEADPIKYRRYIKFVQNTPAIIKDMIDGTGEDEVMKLFTLEQVQRLGMK